MTDLKSRGSQNRPQCVKGHWFTNLQLVRCASLGFSLLFLSIFHIYIFMLDGCLSVTEQWKQLSMECLHRMKVAAGLSFSFELWLHGVSFLSGVDLKRKR